MKIHKIFFLLIFFLFNKIFVLGSSKNDTLSGHWKIIPIPTRESFRAIQAYNAEIIWASGTHGTVIHSSDGGKTWLKDQLSGAEDLDFRGIYVLDPKIILLISAGESEKGQTRIYRTENGGKDWALVFKPREPGIFLDAIQFWNHKRGLILGDPYKGKFFLLSTHDSGKTWDTVNRSIMPFAGADEGAFAASNSSLYLLDHGKNWGQAWFGTGGNSGGRVFYSNDYGNSWDAIHTPVQNGKTAGIFSVHFLNSKEGMATGGDYRKLTDTVHNMVQTHDGGFSWVLSSGTIPGGYTESFTELEKGNRIAIGPGGTSWYDGKLKNWKKCDSLGFHAITQYKKSIWAIGANGLLGNWIF